MSVDAVDQPVSSVPGEAASRSPAAAPIAAPRQMRRRIRVPVNGGMAALLLVLAFAFMTPGLPPDRVAVPTDQLLIFPPWHSLYPAANPSFGGGGDLLLQQLPWRHWMQQELAAGRFPLWASAPVGGTSLFASYQVGVLHPLHLLWALLPVGAGLGIIGALKLWIAGLGMWGFLRALRLHPAAAALSAIAFEFSAWMVDLLPWQITSIQCLLPWMVWAVYAWCQDRARWALPALAGLTACAIFGGHPETLFNVGGLVALWAAGLVVLGSPRRWSWQIGGLALAVAIGFALSAIQLLPFLEALGASHTQAVRGQSNALALAWLSSEKLLYWILPRSWGYFSESILSPGQSFVEHNGYIGLVPLLGLIVTGGAALRRRVSWRQLAPWILISVVSWLLIYDSSGLGRAIRSLPGFSQNANWRWLANLDFALLVVAAYGWDWLARWRPASPGSRTALWQGIGGMLLAQGLGLMVAHALGLLPPPVLVEKTGPWFITNDSYRVYWAIWALGIVVAAVGVLVLWGVGGRNRRGWPVLLGVILLADLWRLFGSVNPTGPASEYFPQTSYIQQVQALVPPTERILFESNGLPDNAALVYGIRDWRSQDALMSERAYQAAILLSPDLPKSVYTEYNFLFFNPRLPVAPLLGMRYYAAPTTTDLTADTDPDKPPFTRRAFKNGMGLWEIEGVPGFTYLSDNLAVVDGEPAARAWMQNVTWKDVRAYMALVEAPAAAVAAVQHDPAGTSPGNVAVQVYTPGSIRLQTTATRPALLVVAESLAPGWRAMLDGQPVPIWRANYLSQGVVVPAGTHTVELHYMPDSFVIGATVSGLALLAWLALALAARRKRRIGVAGARVEVGDATTNPQPPAPNPQ